MTHPIRAQLIAEGIIKPAPAGELVASRSAVQQRQREAGPVAKAIAILEATIKGPEDLRRPAPRRADRRVW